MGELPTNPDNLKQAFAERPEVLDRQRRQAGQERWTSGRPASDGLVARSRCARRHWTAGRWSGLGRLLRRLRLGRAAGCIAWRCARRRCRAPCPARWRRCSTGQHQQPLPAPHGPVCAPTWRRARGQTAGRRGAAPELRGQRRAQHADARGAPGRRRPRQAGLRRRLLRGWTRRWPARPSSPPCSARGPLSDLATRWPRWTRRDDAPRSARARGPAASTPTCWGARAGHLARSRCCAWRWASGGAAAHQVLKRRPPTG